MKRSIPARAAVPVATAALCALLSLGPVSSARALDIAEASTSTSAVATPLARGKYLVTVLGCNDCHTPLKPGAAGPEPDMSRMLSGHPDSLQMPPAPALPEGPWQVVSSGTNTAWSGPWGVSFTANLTPDPDTGLGKWSYANFRDTIRSGRHLGRGRPVLPPMPIPMYRHLTDEDMRAVFAFLQSIPAVKNRVPEPLPPAGAVD